MLIKRGPGGINQISDTHSTSLTFNASSVMSACIITKFYIFVHMAVCSLYPFASGMRSLVEYRICYVEPVFIWKVNMMIQCHKGHFHTSGVGWPECPRQGNICFFNRVHPLKHRVTKYSRITLTTASTINGWSWDNNATQVSALSNTLP